MFSAAAKQLTYFTRPCCGPLGRYSEATTTSLVAQRWGSTLRNLPNSNNTLNTRHLLDARTTTEPLPPSTKLLLLYRCSA